MTGLVGILLALGMLIFLAYRGMSVLILAPLMAMVAASFAAAPLLGLYTQVFMTSAGGFIAAISAGSDLWQVDGRQWCRQIYRSGTGGTSW